MGSDGGGGDGEDEGGSEGDADGGGVSSSGLIDGSGDGDGSGSRDEMQIVKPPKVSAKSEAQLIVEPSATVTVVGPQRPQYLTPLSVIES